VSAEELEDIEWSDAIAEAFRMEWLACSPEDPS